MVVDAMVELKICSRKDCQHRGEPQPISNFYRDNRWLSGLRSECKDCSRAYQQLPESRAYQRDYRQSPEGRACRQSPRAKALVAIAHTRYNQIPEGKMRNAHKQARYRQTPKGKATHRQADARYRQNPQYKLNSNMRKGIHESLKGKKNGRHWESLVGYTILDLTRRLEALFTDGMTWDNYGKWHIDHIIPLSAFNFSSADDYDFKKCWALSNLQPLWQAENLRKHNKVDRIAREITRGEI